MDRQTLTQVWDHFRQKYGVYLHLLQELPEKRYHSHPGKGMRTPAQLVAHISGSIVRDIARGVAKGAITSDESAEDIVAEGFRTQAHMLSFVRECWEQADQAVRQIGDEQLNAMVPTPWNMKFRGAVGFQIMGDEFLHHRGQLYVFARIYGVQPPFIWGFDQNEVAFLPS
jgi:uncharacterized damage-inducible protein DinB